MKEDRYVLTMLSGGRDSLLTAALLAEIGYTIIPVTFDNGHIMGISEIGDIYHTLVSKYGTNKVSLFKNDKYPESITPYIQNTAMTLHNYAETFWKQSVGAMAADYPELKGYQVHCLCCKTAMYVHAIATCKCYDIPYIAEGTRKSQGFITDKTEMMDRFLHLCRTNEVDILTPVYDISDDYDRKRMLSDRGLPTKTLEPQCFLGCPLESGGITETAKASLLKFYDTVLKDKLQKDIDSLVASKRWI